MNKHVLDSSVVIVGAGPVGLTLGCILGREGISVNIYERNATLYEVPRAVGFDDESMRCFQSIGLAEKLATDMMLGAGIKYYGERDNYLMTIHPDDRPYGHFKGAAFLQHFLERDLLAKLKTFPTVTIQFNTTVAEVTQSKHCASVNLRDGSGQSSTVRCQYLVGCDGGRSTVRNQANIAMLGNTFAERWLIVDTVKDTYTTRYAECWCNSARPTVSIPRKYGHRRWEFMLKPHEAESDMVQTTRVNALLSERIDIKDLNIIRKKVYTFHARIAESFRSGRIFLAGDACHLSPPFAAQGMVAGIRDADNLGWKLSRVIKGEAYDQILDTYEQEREPHVRCMIDLAKRAGNLMMPKRHLKSLLRDKILAGILAFPSMREAVRQAKMRPKPEYKKGLISPRMDKRARNGWMFPQPLVTTSRGQNLLLDELLGNSFALVAYGVEPTQGLTDAFLEKLIELKTSVLLIVPQGMVGTQIMSNPNCVWAEDLYNQMGAWLDEYPNRRFLIRPDKYILADFSVAEQNRVLDYLGRSFTPPKNLECLGGLRKTA